MVIRILRTVMFTCRNGKKIRKQRQRSSGSSGMIYECLKVKKGIYKKTRGRARNPFGKHTTKCLQIGFHLVSEYCQTTSTSDAVLRNSTARSTSTSDAVLCNSTARPTSTSDVVLCNSTARSTSTSDAVLCNSTARSTSTSDAVLCNSTARSTSTSDAVFVTVWPGQ